MSDAGVALHVMAIADDAGTLALMERTLKGSDDDLSVSTDLAEGLARTAAEAPDVVFVDVALGGNAGLAVVHHIRAIAPSTAVYALARGKDLELGSQAVALGGTGVVMLPISGDELLTVLSDVRTRLAERFERTRLEREAALSRRGTSLARRVGEIAEASTRREAAQRLVGVLTEAGAKTVLVYLPTSEGDRQLMRAGAAGEVGGAPSFCEDMEILQYAAAHHLEVVRLALRQQSCGLLLLGGLPHGEGEDPIPLAELVAAQAATALALIGQREQSHSGAMKDPASSAYTFAYFVDVTGREIDKARRHSRRFALATLSVENPDITSAVGIELAERVLTAVRDTDVLARVDEREFYLLLPETGGMGARTCRRRVMELLAPLQKRGRGNEGALDVTMGVATFPHDGTDLSQLLRVAKHRAEQSKGSVVKELDLARMPLGELLDAVLWSVGGPRSADAPKSIELPTLDLAGLAVSVVGDAMRGGSVRIVASQRSGMSVGAAVRSVLEKNGDEAHFDAVDLRDVRGCEDIEALAVLAEHGSYVLLGRIDHGVVRAVHSSDPALTDLVVQRLGEAVGLRLLD